MTKTSSNHLNEPLIDTKKSPSDIESQLPIHMKSKTESSKSHSSISRVLGLAKPEKWLLVVGVIMMMGSSAYVLIIYIDISK